MSQENVQLVRTILDDVNADRSEVDAEGLLTRLADEELLDPEIEWDASEVPILDLAGVYRGIEGVRQYWRSWLAAWELGHFEFTLLDAGDRVVALFHQQRMRGRSTGIEMPVPEYATVMTIRDGLLVHWKLYVSQSEALEAVGLSEQDVHADS
jgi:hypothetical protein